MLSHQSAIEQIRRKHKTEIGDHEVGVLRHETRDVAMDTTNENRDITVVATTAAIDCDDEVLVPDGADLSYINRNRKVILDHNVGYRDMVGSIRRGYPKLVDGRWLARIQIQRSDMGDQILRDAADFGIGVSVGFEYLDVSAPTDDEIEQYGGGKRFRSIVRKWKWLELTVTPMPCNPEAQSIMVSKSAPAPSGVKRFVLTPHAVIRIGVDSVPQSV